MHILKNPPNSISAIKEVNQLHNNNYANMLKIFSILLIIWGIFIEFFLGYPWIALKTIPLILCLHGILYMRIYTLQCLLIILHLYLFEGIVSISSSPYPLNLYGSIGLLLTIITYSYTLLYLYPYKKQAKKLKLYKNFTSTKK